MNKHFLRCLAVGVPVLMWGFPVAAQETRSLSLAEARAEARAAGPGVRAARERARGALESGRVVAAGRWPSLGLEVGMVRSTDPVAAFGSRLRQGRFTEADFAVDRLNRPAALTDWNAGVGMTWTPLDLSREAAVQGARAEGDAAAASAAWTARAAEFDAEVRYVELVAAARWIAAAGATVTAAESALSRVENRRREGFAMDADVLQARAALERARAMRIEAEGHLAEARFRLALALGWDASVTPAPTDDVLADDDVGEQLRGLDGTATVLKGDAPGYDDPDDSPFTAATLASRRPDLRASQLGLDAARARVVQADRVRLPTVEGFASVQSHMPEPFAGAEEHWTIGLRIRVPLFTGFRVSGVRAAARASALAAGEDHDDRLARATVEALQARVALSTAEQTVLAAESAQAASDEAARLVGLRFEQGLATTSDLLGAEADAAGFAFAALNARLNRRIAISRLRFLSDSESHS